MYRVFFYWSPPKSYKCQIVIVSDSKSHRKSSKYKNFLRVIFRADQSMYIVHSGPFDCLSLHLQGERGGGGQGIRLVHRHGAQRLPRLWRWPFPSGTCSEQVWRQSDGRSSIFSQAIAHHRGLTCLWLLGSEGKLWVMDKVNTIFPQTICRHNQGLIKASNT